MFNSIIFVVIFRKHIKVLFSYLYCPNMAAKSLDNSTDNKKRIGQEFGAKLISLIEKVIIFLN